VEPDAAIAAAPRRRLLDDVPKYDARGMACKVHVAGEGSTRKALRVYGRVLYLIPNGRRHEIAHCNAVLPGVSHRELPSTFSSIQPLGTK
jgi:predicted amidohydrolase YtcJ